MFSRALEAVTLTSEQRKDLGLALEKGADAEPSCGPWASRVASSWHAVADNVAIVTAGDPEPEAGSARGSDSSDDDATYVAARTGKDEAAWQALGAHVCAVLATFSPLHQVRVDTTVNLSALTLEWSERSKWGTRILVCPETSCDYDGAATTATAGAATAVTAGAGDSAGASASSAQTGTVRVVYKCLYSNHVETTELSALDVRGAAAKVERWVCLSAMDWCARSCDRSATKATLKTMVSTCDAASVLNRLGVTGLEAFCEEALCAPDRDDEGSVAAWEADEPAARAAVRVLLRHLSRTVPVGFAGRKLFLSADRKTLSIVWGDRGSAVSAASMRGGLRVDGDRIIGYAITVSQSGALHLGDSALTFGGSPPPEFSVMDERPEHLKTAAEAVPYVVAVCVHMRHFGCSSFAVWPLDEAVHEEGVRRDIEYARYHLGFELDLGFALAMRQLGRQLWVVEGDLGLTKHVSRTLRGNWRLLCEHLWWVALVTLQKRKGRLDRLHCAWDLRDKCLSVWATAIEPEKDAAWNVHADDLPVRLAVLDRDSGESPSSYGPPEEHVKALIAFTRSAPTYDLPARASELTCKSLCKYFLDGKCRQGAHCTFLHAHLDAGGAPVDFEFDEDKTGTCGLCRTALIQPAARWLRDPRDARRRMLRTVTVRKECVHSFHWDCWDRWENGFIARGTAVFCPGCPPKTRLPALVLWGVRAMSRAAVRQKHFDTVRRGKVTACKYACLGIGCPWQSAPTASAAGAGAEEPTRCPFSHDPDVVAEERKWSGIADLRRRLSDAALLLKYQVLDQVPGPGGGVRRRVRAPTLGCGRRFCAVVSRRTNNRRACQVTCPRNRGRRHSQTCDDDDHSKCARDPLRRCCRGSSR